MKNKPLRLVIDTNWWVSFVIKKYEGPFLAVLTEPRFRIFYSDELATEVRGTMQNPKMAKYFSPRFIGDFLAFFPKELEKVRVRSVVEVCRDPKDNFLLALSKDAKADFLITGDKDLLVLGQFEMTKILTLTAFLEAVKN